MSAEFCNQKKPRKLEIGTGQGFDAFGKFVPPERRADAYKMCKEVIGVSSSQEAWECVNGMAEQITRDEPYEAMRIGMRYVDLTATYMLIAALCTEPTPQKAQT